MVVVLALLLFLLLVSEILVRFDRDVVLFPRVPWGPEGEAPDESVELGKRFLILGVCTTATAPLVRR